MIQIPQVCTDQEPEGGDELEVTFLSPSLLATVCKVKGNFVYLM